MKFNALPPILLIGPLVGVILYLLITTVGPREVGLRNSFGQIAERSLDPGLHFRVPFAYDIVKMDTSLHKNEVISSASSSDMQEITTTAAINWRVSRKDARTVFLNLGNSDNFDLVIYPIISETLKSQMSKYTAEDVLKKRAEIKAFVDINLTEKLLEYGIVMDGFNIIDIKFSPEFTKAIEEKQIAEQHMQKSKYEATSAIERARGESEATVQRARGEAEAQKLLQLSITETTLQNKMIEKWDGKLPVYSSETPAFVNFKP